MKNLLLTVVIFLTAFTIHAQHSTKGFSFQGYASDPEGKALGSVGITVKFTLYSGTNTNLTYVEEQSLTTDAYGVFSATVGEGTVVGADTKTPYAALNLNLYKYSLKVEVKKTAGGSYTEISDEELNAVPYARSAENGVPVGTIVSFAGPVANIPEGWAICDGTQVDGTQDEWKALYDVLGNTWGGAGTTFSLPELRGFFLRGWSGDLGTARDENSDTRIALASGGNTGNNVGTYQGGDIQSHSHSASSGGAGAHSVSVPFQGTQGGYIPTNQPFRSLQGTDRTSSNNYTVNVGNHSHSVTVSNSGGAETRPENAYVIYIIKK